MVKSTEKRDKDDGDHHPLTEPHPKAVTADGEEGNPFQSIPLQELSVTGGHDNHGFQDDTALAVNGSNGDSRVISRQDGRVWLKSNTPPLNNKNSESNLGENKQSHKESEGKAPQNGDAERGNLNTFGREKNPNQEKNNINGNHTSPKLATRNDNKSPIAEPVKEYYIPVNTHRKFLRGEKLYLTHDKRSPNRRSWRKIVICGIVWTFIAVIAITAALAATGVILSKPMQTDSDKQNSDYSSQLSSGQEEATNVFATDSPDFITIGSDIYPTVDSDIHLFDPSFKSYKGTMKIENLQFIEELRNSNSIPFRSLASDLENKIYDLYRPKSISKVRIENFRAGSVWADFLIAWESSSNNLLAEEIEADMKSHLNRTGGYLERYLINSSSIIIADTPRIHGNEESTAFSDSEATTTESDTFSLYTKDFGISHSDDTHTSTENIQTQESSTTPTTMFSLFFYHLTTTDSHRIQIVTDSTPAEATSTSSTESTDIIKPTSSDRTDYGRAMNIWNVTIDNETETKSPWYTSVEGFYTPTEEIGMDEETNQSNVTDEENGIISEHPQVFSTFETITSEPPPISFNNTIITTEGTENESDNRTDIMISNDVENISEETTFDNSDSSVTTEKQTYSTWPQFFTHKFSDESDTTTAPVSEASSTNSPPSFPLFINNISTKNDTIEISSDFTTSEANEQQTDVENSTSSFEPRTFPFLFNFFTTSSSIEESSQNASTMNNYSFNSETTLSEDGTGHSTQSSTLLDLVIKLSSSNATENSSDSLNNEFITTNSGFNYFTGSNSEETTTSIITTEFNTSSTSNNSESTDVESDIKINSLNSNSEVNMTLDTSSTTSSYDISFLQNVSVTSSSNQTLFSVEQDMNSELFTLESESTTNASTEQDIFTTTEPNTEVGSMFNPNDNETSVEKKEDDKQTSESTVSSTSDAGNQMDLISNTENPTYLNNNETTEIPSTLQPTSDVNTSSTNDNSIGIFGKEDSTTPSSESEQTQFTQSDQTHSTESTSLASLSEEDKMNVNNFTTKTPLVNDTLLEVLFPKTHEVDNNGTTEGNEGQDITTENTATVSQEVHVSRIMDDSSASTVDSFTTANTTNDSSPSTADSSTTTNTTISPETETPPQDITVSDVKLENNSTSFTLFPLITKQNYQGFLSTNNKVYFSDDKDKLDNFNNETFQLDAIVTIDDKNSSFTNESANSMDVSTITNAETTSSPSSTLSINGEISYMSDTENAQTAHPTVLFNNTDLTFKAFDTNESEATDKSILSNSTDSGTLMMVSRLNSSIRENQTMHEDVSEIPTDKNITGINGNGSSSPQISADTLKVHFNLSNQMNSTNFSSVSTDKTLNGGMEHGSSSVSVMTEFNSTETATKSETLAEASTTITSTLDFSSESSSQQTPTTLKQEINASVSDSTFSNSTNSTTLSQDLSSTTTTSFSGSETDMTVTSDVTSISTIDTESAVSSTTENDLNKQTTANSSMGSSSMSTSVTEETTTTTTTTTTAVSTASDASEYDSEISTVDYFSNNLNEFNTPNNNNNNFGEISYTNDNN